MRPRAFLRIRFWCFQALPKLLTAWRGPILLKTNRNRQNDDSHQVSAELSPQPALYDPHKDTFMCCLKNETPLAAQASGLINFPAPNSAEIKAGKGYKCCAADDSLSWDTPGLPGLSHPACWMLVTLLWQHRAARPGGFGDTPTFPGIPGEFPFSALQYPGTVLRKQKAGEGCERDKNVGILMSVLLDGSMGTWSRKHS